MFFFRHVIVNTLQKGANEDDDDDDDDNNDNNTHVKLEFYAMLS